MKRLKSQFIQLCFLGIVLAVQTACSPQAINAGSFKKTVNSLLDSTASTTATQLKILTPLSFVSDTDTPLSAQPSFEAVNAKGERVSNYIRFVEFHAYSDAACTVEIPSVVDQGSGTVTSGQVSFSALRLLSTQVASLKLSDGTISSPCLPGLNISPGVVASLEFSVAPSPLSVSADAGFSVQPVVRAYDAHHNLVTNNSTSNISLTANDGATCAGTDLTAVLAGTTTATLSAGVASFTNVQPQKIAIRSLKASLGSISACFPNLAITAGVPSAISAASGSAQSGTVSSALASPLVVSVVDANGNAVNGAVIDWTVVSGGGTLSSLSSTSSSSGQANAAYTLGAMAGASSISATVHGTAVSVNFSASAVAGVANKLAFSTQPVSSSVAGGTLSTQPAVSVADANGNLVSSSSASIALSLFSDAACTNAAATTPNSSASVSGTTSVAASSGTASFSGLQINLAASSLYFKASSSGLSSACSSAVSVSPAAFSLSQSAITSTNTVASGSSITATLTAKDNFGNLNPSGLTAASFSASGVGGTGTFGSVTAAGSGVYTSVFTAQTAGSLVIYGSLNGSVISSNQSLTIGSGTLSKIIFSANPSNSGNADSNLSSQPSISGADAYNNIVASYAGTVTLQAYSDTSCTTALPGALSATTNPITATSGSASFSGVRILKTSAQSIGASDGTMSVCFATLSIAAGAANQLAFSTAPSSTAVVGTALVVQPVVSVRDANGNSNPGSIATVALSVFNDSSCTTAAATAPDASASLVGTASVAASSGIASFSGLKLNLASSSLYFKASSAGLTSACSSAVSVSPDAFSLANSLVTSSNTVASGSSITATLTAKDTYGNGNPSGITSTSFSSSMVGGTGTFGSVTAAGAGVYTASFTAQNAGSVSLYGSINGSTVSGNQSVTVTAGALTQLVFSTLPSSSGNTDSALSTQPSVSGADASGNTVSTYNGSITLSTFSDTACATALPSAMTASSNPVTASSGTANFSGVQLVSTQTRSISASDGTRSVCTPVTVNPGALDSIVYNVQPAPLSITANTAFTSQPAIQLLDAHLNVITTNSSSSAVLSGYDAAACAGSVVASGLGGTLTQSASSGVVGFTDVKAAKVSVKSILATVGAKTACSSTLSVSAGSASLLALTSGNSQTGAVSTALASPFTVTATDSSGNPVSGATINWTVGSGGGSLSSASSTTNASGVASITYTLGASTGTNTVTATLASTSATQSFTATAIGNATKLVFTTQPSNSGYVGTVLPQQPVVAVQDASGVTVAGANNTVTLNVFSDSGCRYLEPFTLGGQSSLAGSSSIAAVNGIASFSGLIVQRSGNTYLQASSGTLTSACSSLSSYSPLVGYSLKVIGANRASRSVCSSLSAYILDSYGNRANAYGTVNVTSNSSPSTFSDSSCQYAQAASGSGYVNFYFTDNVEETLTFTASSSGFTSATLSVTVGNPSSSLVLFQPDANTSLNQSAGIASPSALFADGTNLYLGESYRGNGNRISMWAATSAAPPATFATRSLVMGAPNPNLIDVRSQIYASSNYFFNVTGLLTVGTKLFAAESNRILVWNTIPTTNNAVPSFALGVSNFTSPGGSPMNAQTVRTPRQMASDGVHFVVADSENCRILIWNSIPTSFNQAADLEVGQAIMSNYNCYNGSTNKDLGTTSGVAIFGTKLLATDAYNNRVLVWNTFPTSNYQPADVVIGQTGFPGGGFGTTQNKLASPNSLYVSPSGKLYVADSLNYRVMIWNSIPTVNGAPADYVLGNTSFTSNSYLDPAVRFRGTLNVTGDGTNIYVSDLGSNRIQVFTSPIVANGQTPDRMLGQADFQATGANSPGLPSASNVQPVAGGGGYATGTAAGVCSDGTRLYVADQMRNRILVFNSMPTVQNQAADLVLGQANFSDSASSTTQQGMSGPNGIDCDSNYLAVADQTNNRILIWNLPITANNQAANVVVGQSNFTVNLPGVTRGTMNLPTGVSIKYGKLLVADKANNRILLWNSVPTTSGVNPDLVLNQPNFTSQASYYDNFHLSTATSVTYDGVHVIASGLYSGTFVWNTFPTYNGQIRDIEIGISMGSVYSTGSSLYGGAAAIDGSTDLLAIRVTEPFPTASSQYAQRYIGRSSLSATLPPALGTDGMSGRINLNGVGTKLLGYDPLYGRLMIWNTLP